MKVEETLENLCPCQERSASDSLWGISHFEIQTYVCLPDQLAVMVAYHFDTLNR